MRLGEDVEVRSRFDGRWVGGFEVAGVEGRGPERTVRLRRRSDGAVLPTAFRIDDVRRAAASGRAVPVPVAATPATG